MWKGDPIVRLEKAMWPVIPQLMFYYDQTFAYGVESYDRLRQTLNFAVRELHEVAVGPMADANVSLSKEGDAIIRALSKKLHDLSIELPQRLEDDVRADLMVEIRDKLMPEIEEGLDIFRATFISTVVTRQREADKRSKAAQMLLKKVSKQIFYVSINATVEAKRAGESGKVFNTICEEIRDLARKVEASIPEL